MPTPDPVPGSDLYTPPSMGDMILDACRRWADRTALVDAGQSLSYRALGERVAQTVAHFKSIGLQPGDPLALLTKNCVEGVIVYYAANVLGLRYTPLHPMGGLDDHAFIVEDGEVGTLAVDKPFEKRAMDLLERSSRLDRLIRLRDPEHPDDLGRAFDRDPPAEVSGEAAPDSDVTLIYTGGTTGRPKGVRHRPLVGTTLTLMALAEWEWPGRPMTLVATPISHAGMSLLLPTHWLGGTVYLEEQFTPGGFLKSVDEKKINVTFMVPTMIYSLLDDGGPEDHDLSAMELILYGAAPMSPTRLEEAIDRIGPVFAQIYGQSEAPMLLTYMTRDEHVEAIERGDTRRLTSCGAVCAGVDLALLDEEGRAVGKPGDIGEICVRGPLVMQGYYKRPEETADVFRHGWLHTGDMAFCDEAGYYYIVDRSKDMIISGGFNVFPKEIEDILGAHPDVSSVAVIGVPDEKWGEKVMAIVVPRPGREPDADELRQRVRDAKGAVYSPKVVEFASSIPVTALGKPDKKALRAKYWGERDRNVS